jgi:hypothetical protein
VRTRKCCTHRVEPKLEYAPACSGTSRIAVDNACLASRRRPTCRISERFASQAAGGSNREAATHLVRAGAEIVVCLHISSAKSNGGIEEIDSLPKRESHVRVWRHDIVY